MSVGGSLYILPIAEKMKKYRIKWVRFVGRIKEN